MEPLPYTELPRLSGHAVDELRRRGIPTGRVRTVLEAPQQWFPVRPGRVVLQAIDPSSGRLLRVFVDIDRSPPVVVTAYETSKIEKYWRPT